MKKLFKFLVLVVIVCAAVYFGPRLIHKCDSCEDWIIGTGYKANVIVDVVSDDDLTICKECAETQHLIETTLGKSLDDYRKPLFD